MQFIVEFIKSVPPNYSVGLPLSIAGFVMFVCSDAEWYWEMNSRHWLSALQKTRYGPTVYKVMAFVVAAMGLLITLKTWKL